MISDGTTALAVLSDRGGPQDLGSSDGRSGRQRAAEPDQWPGQSGRFQGAELIILSECQRKEISGRFYSFCCLYNDSKKIGKI